MVELPDPEMFQVAGAVPGLLFSQATGLIAGAHGSAAALAARAGPSRVAMSRTAAAAATRVRTVLDMRCPPRRSDGAVPRTLDPPGVMAGPRPGGRTSRSPGRISRG